MHPWGLGKVVDSNFTSFPSPKMWAFESQTPSLIIICELGNSHSSHFVRTLTAFQVYQLVQEAMCVLNKSLNSPFEDTVILETIAMHCLELLIMFTKIKMVETSRNDLIISLLMWRNEELNEMHRIWKTGKIFIYQACIANFLFTMLM